MSIQRSYDRWAASYDRDQNLTRDLDASLTRERLNAMHFDSVLEIGCGTGKNTVFLSSIASRVCALDFSHGMLEQARAKILASNVRFVRSDLTRPWPAQSSAFDLLACNLVLEHIHDLKPVFAEAFRVMAPGGLFHVSELHPFRQYLGGRAQYLTDTGRAEIAAHIHHISDFVQAAQAAGLKLDDFHEAWHSEDQDKPPRLAVFKFIK